MSEKVNKVQAHMDICDELNKLYERKNHDYGDSFHQTFVEEGMAMARIRLGDKFSRFKTLTKLAIADGNQQKVTDESVRDTLLDLANYAIMTVMEMDMAKQYIEFSRQCTEQLKGIAESGVIRPYKKESLYQQFRHIFFGAESDAKNFIIQMNSIITKSGFVTVADCKELLMCDGEPNYEDLIWGWKYNISSDTIKETDDGWIVKLPLPQLLERQE